MPSKVSLQNPHAVYLEEYPSREIPYDVYLRGLMGMPSPEMVTLHRKEKNDWKREHRHPQPKLKRSKTARKRAKRRAAYKAALKAAKRGRHWTKLHRGPRGPEAPKQVQMAWRAQVIKALGSVCSKCDSGGNLNIHHKLRDGWKHRKASPNVYEDMFQDLRNYKLLCVRCHYRAHGEGRTWGGRIPEVFNLFPGHHDEEKPWGGLFDRVK